MRVAVISCWKYRDAWQPFFALFRKFWPDCPYSLVLVSDYIGTSRIDCATYTHPGSWCEVLAAFCGSSDERFLLFQEDMFLNSPVSNHLINRGFSQMNERNSGMVRLYPCPGGDEDCGDEHFGIVPRGTPYRISCQASIWRPNYLYDIASRFNTPSEFEINGSRFADTLPDPVLAFRRDVQPWPLSYLCSAISRGLWNPAAKRLCDEHGIENDWTMRGFQPA